MVVAQADRSRATVLVSPPYTFSGLIMHYAGSYGAWNYQRMRFYKYAAPTVLESNFAQGITTNPARHEGGEEIGSGTIIPLFT